MEPAAPAFAEPTTLLALLRAAPGCGPAGAATGAVAPPAPAPAPAAGGPPPPAAGGFAAVPVEEALQLSYDAFVSRYMAPNRPVLIRVRRRVRERGRAAAAAAAARAAAGLGARGPPGSGVSRLNSGPLAPRCVRRAPPPAGPRRASGSRPAAASTSRRCARSRRPRLSASLTPRGGWRWVKGRRAGCAVGGAAAGRQLVPAGAVLNPCAARAPGPRRRHAGCGPCEEMALGEYCDWWACARPGAQAEHAGAQQQPPQPAAPQQPAAQQQRAWGQRPADTQQAPGRPAGADGRLLYLKDWHLAAERPDTPAYTLPRFFSEDWLNAFYCDGCGGGGGGSGGGEEGAGGGGGSASSGRRDSTGGGGEGGEACSGGGAAPPGRPVATADYRFVYLGPAGSWTPLHADVLTSFSWSANVAGAKRWLLLAPEHARLLRGRRGGGLAPDFFIGDLCGGGGGGGGESNGSGGGGGVRGSTAAAEEGEALDAADFPGLPAAQRLLHEVIQVGAGPGDGIGRGWKGVEIIL
jgi:hypothetical protein